MAHLPSVEAGQSTRRSGVKMLAKCGILQGCPARGVVNIGRVTPFAAVGLPLLTWPKTGAPERGRHPRAPAPPRRPDPPPRAGWTPQPAACVAAVPRSVRITHAPG